MEVFFFVMLLSIIFLFAYAGRNKPIIINGYNHSDCNEIVIYPKHTVTDIIFNNSVDPDNYTAIDIYYYANSLSSIVNDIRILKYKGYYHSEIDTDYQEVYVYLNDGGTISQGQPVRILFDQLPTSFSLYGC